MLPLRYVLSFAITWHMTLATRPETQGAVITFGVPAGYGWNGTVVVDRPKVTEYLEKEVGMNLEGFIAYLRRTTPPQTKTEYRFPEGSGMDSSSVTWEPDELQQSYNEFVRNGDRSDIDCDCNCCWSMCLA
ncbi:hypothetical protein DL764_006928 [Monosporascus ibericus]|uniref:Uncharacterized protein n=1 Tax=Monosporascus ibericus TaxID=155417 RepID=A0A4Q4T5Q6_9PEZI|nr:hypothetical protein DL764_006928 [Monosporascus ibericus]